MASLCTDTMSALKLSNSKIYRYVGIFSFINLNLALIVANYNRLRQPHTQKRLYRNPSTPLICSREPWISQRILAVRGHQRGLYTVQVRHRTRHRNVYATPKQVPNQINSNSSYGFCRRCKKRRLTESSMDERAPPGEAQQFAS